MTSYPMAGWKQTHMALVQLLAQKEEKHAAASLPRDCSGAGPKRAGTIEKFMRRQKSNQII